MLHVIKKYTCEFLIKYMTKALFNISVINAIQIFLFLSLSLPHGVRSVNPVSRFKAKLV